MAVQPPSITIDVPVIIEDASEAKKVIDVATSLIDTTFLIGVLSFTYLLYFLSAKYFFVLGVRTIFGQTLLTLMLYLLNLKPYLC